jgi:hypothetical protein
VWIASEIIPRSRYGYASERIRSKIASLRERRPADVDAKQWDECVGWAVTAHCNICFSEGHTSFQEMRRFEADLDEKLKGDVGPDTLKWTLDRLAATGPTGERYIVRFREQWADALRSIIE